jgi:cell division protein FtsI/penicillin-binding protein 2
MAGSRRIAKWAIPAALIVVTLVAVATSLRGRGTDGATPDATVGTSTPLPSADPTETARSFLDSWSGQDWDSVGALVAGDPAEASDGHAEWWEALGVDGAGFTLGEVTATGSAATATFTAAVDIAGAETWRYGSSMNLAASGDTWVVDWAPSILHPSLAPGDRLAVRVEWPQRAPIVDVASTLLVGNAPSVVVGLIPGRVTSRQDLYGPIEEVLGVASAEVDAILDAPGVQPDWFLPVATIGREVYPDVRPVLYPVPGVAFRVEPGRQPAEQGLAADLVGRTGPITAELLDELGSPYTADSVVGRSGLERALEDLLAGEPDFQVVRVRSAEPDFELHRVAGSPSAPVAVSLDIAVQRAAEQVVAAVAEPAALVAIDAATGEVRGAAANSSAVFNAALAGLYPPGSTFKIVVAAALLESGLGPDDVVECPRVVTVDGREFRNAATLAESMTFEQAVALSCNTAFIQLGVGLPDGVVAGMAERFGFDGRLDLGVPSALGSFPEPVDRVDLAASMIGQGNVLASPLQMASVAATASSGRRFTPGLLAGEGSEGTAVLAPDVAADLTRMLVAVVTGGTGRAAAVEGREVAGKTGTAQIGEGDTADTIAWFAGFSGDLAFAVVVEGGTSGGGAAAPLAGEFLVAVNEPVPAPGSAPCVAAGADWLTFQGTNARTGCSEAAAIAQPELLWTAEVGIQAWLNSPLVMGDTVIVGSAGTRRAGSDDAEGVYALDLATGDRRWFFPTDNDVNGIAASPDGAPGGMVVVTGDEGAVWGLAASTGEELWRFEVGTNVFTNPIVIDDGSRRIVVVGDATGTVWGIGLEGTELWQARLDGAIRGGAASDGRLVYVVSDHGDMAAFNLDGFEIWHTLLEYPGAADEAGVTVYAAPTLVDDLVVVSFVLEGGPTGPGVVALDRFVGRVAWWGTDPDQVSPAGWGSVRSSPAVAGDGLVIAGSVAEGPQLVAAETGEGRWVAGTGVSCERQWASPVVIGDLVVLPRPDGAVYGFDAAGGGLRWRLPLTVPGELAPLSECTDGASTVRDGFEFQASAAVAPDGTIVVASMGQVIYAVGGS